jgi:hypothetical protein
VCAVLPLLVGVRWRHDGQDPELDEDASEALGAQAAVDGLAWALGVVKAHMQDPFLVHCGLRCVEAMCLGAGLEQLEPLESGRPHPHIRPVLRVLQAALEAHGEDVRGARPVTALRHPPPPAPT